MHASIHTLKSTTDGNDMMLKVWKVWSLMARILQYKSNKNTSRQRCTLDCECISLNFPHIFCVENAVSHDEECPVNFCIHITLIQQTQILTLPRIIHKRRNLNHFTFFSKFQHMNHHHHQFLNREGRWRTTDDFTTSFLFSLPDLHCPQGLGELQACPFPDVVSPPLPLSALSSSPFQCALQCGFGQTWWSGDMSRPLQSASLYDGQDVFVWSDCLLDPCTDFLVVTWSLYEMRCILR